MSTLLPHLERAGFVRVDFELDDPGNPVAGREIILERLNADTFDRVIFNFDKYGAPRVQAHLSRRLRAPPHEFLRSGNLVLRPSQYYHFWGKPWWVPTKLWPSRGALRTVALLEERIPDALSFLETGRRSRCISARISGLGRQNPTE
ncbi:MAG: hypothetical protein JSS86_00020 [Cyanobacteria bacterium SZAS LIN-2]|nr:hypothetical protein [Cyanobacteria bacterium SZAS LIN-2]